MEKVIEKYGHTWKLEEYVDKDITNYQCEEMDGIEVYKVLKSYIKDYPENNIHLGDLTLGDTSNLNLDDNDISRNHAYIRLTDGNGRCIGGYHLRGYSSKYILRMYQEFLAVDIVK